MQFGDRHAVSHGDVIGAVDALDEIARHAVGKRLATDKDGDGPGMVSEVERCLPRGVPGPDHEHVLAGRRHGFGHRRAVEQARPGETVGPGNIEQPI